MKVHRVRTRTLWLFLVAFSASTSALGTEEVGVVCTFTLFDELGTGPEIGGACFVEELGGRSCESGLSTVVGRARWELGGGLCGSLGGVGRGERTLGLVEWPSSGGGGASARGGLTFAVRGKGSGDSMGGGSFEIGKEFPDSESARGAVYGGDSGSYVSPPDGDARFCTFFSRREAFAAFLRAVLEGLACVPPLQVWG
jgi:hypothetical protein